MTSEFPYTKNVGTMKRFFERIPEIGTPEKITFNLLYNLGFKSTNDRPIISILRFLKFTDSSGNPSEYYKIYKDKSKSRIVLGKAIKESYSELFKLYPNAEKQDINNLRNFFSTHTKGAEQTLKAMVDTFKTLCLLASFDDISFEEFDNFSSSDEVKDNSLIKTDIGEFNLPLAENRKVKILFPRDITEEEINKLKKLLDALI